jgi:ABC-2 type transport system permease protein
MKTLALTRATLRGTTWISTDGLRELGRRDQLWLLPVAGLGTLAGLGVMVFMMTGVYRSLLATGAAMGHPEMVVFYGLFCSWLFIFALGVPLALSVLYYSTDLRLLLTLPLSPRRIIAAKCFLLYCYALPVNLVVVTPALWLFAGAQGLSAAAVVSGAAALLLLPALPLAVSVLFVIGLTRLVNLSRFRVALEMVGMLVAVALLVGFQVLLSRSSINAAMQGGMTQNVSGLAGMYDAMTKGLPPAAWAARSFTPGAGLGPLGLSVLTAAALCAAALLLAPVNFLHDVMERPQRARKARAAGAAAGATSAALKPRSVTARLLAREWSLLASNSTFLFEAMGELVILPLVLGLYALIIPKDLLGQAMSFIAAMPVLAPACMAAMALMTGLTTVSATSLSREGARISLSLAMPVPGRVQVGAKLWLHLLFFGTAYLVDTAILWVIFRFPLAALAYMIPGGLALQVVGFCVGIWLDLKRPLLTWTHPQQAMKNNMNALSGIGITAAIDVAIFAPVILLVLKGVSPFLLGGAAAAVSAALAAILLPRVLAFADRQYAGGLELGG